MEPTETARVVLHERYVLEKYAGDSTDPADLVETVVIEDGRVVERIVHRAAPEEET